MTRDARQQFYCMKNNDADCFTLKPCASTHNAKKYLLRLEVPPRAPPFVQLSVRTSWFFRYLSGFFRHLLHELLKRSWRNFGRPATLRKVVDEESLFTGVPELKKWFCNLFQRDLRDFDLFPLLYFIQFHSIMCCFFRPLRQVEQDWQYHVRRFLMKLNPDLETERVNK